MNRKDRTSREDPAPSRALPEHVKAVGPETTPEPLADTDAEVWNRWSRDREIRDAVERRQLDLENREVATRAIYPRECAERLADAIKTVAPDWRTARPTLGPAWGQLLKQQPELAPELTRRREAIITALFNHTPPEFHRALTDLRKLIELMLEAHEAAAYLVGWEGGRQHERLRVDARGRVRQGTRSPSQATDDALTERLSAILDGHISRVRDHLESRHVCPLVSLPEDGTTLQDIEKAALVAALERTAWVQADAARLLRIGGGPLNQRIKRHRVTFPTEYQYRRRHRQAQALASTRQAPAAGLRLTLAD